MIRLTSIQYHFDNSTTKTDSITCGFSVTSGQNDYLNGSVTLLAKDLEEGTVLDGLNRSEIEQLAKQRLLTLVQKSVEGK